MGEKREPTTSEYIEVRNSRIHNKGVFAAKEIPKGTEVIEYVGEKIGKREAEERADKQFKRGKDKKNGEGHVYIFELNKRYDIDGNFSWNTARLINHSCDPNCEAEIEDNKRIWITSIKDIKKGEEITFNYGYSIDNFEDHLCKCGSKNCIGYIVDKKKWPKLKRLLKKDDKTKS
ncbi:MAG: SET domain-containing protein-lysine N-methyltransferase [Candidatus Pacearchaeota archaeon]